METLINPRNLILTSDQLARLMPYFIVTLGAMIVLVVGVLRSIKATTLVTAGLSILTLVGAAYSVTRIWGEPQALLFNNMLASSDFSHVFNLIFLCATGLVILSSYSYLEREKIHHMEYYSLLLFSCLGMMLLASSVDLIVLFVSLEIMSIAVYVLVGFRRTDIKSNEAAVKYFVLGSAASAILLLGAAFLYGATGTMNLYRIGAYLQSHIEFNSLFVLGSILVLSGFFFKVATVPFHMWMPDVYEGAPTTVTTFMTTGLKASAFAAFMRVFLECVPLHIPDLNDGFRNVMWLIAVLTMFIGNVIALTQTNFKRMLAYSSIAHSGYILIGFIVGSRSEYGYASVILYLIAYVIMNIGAFTIIAMLAEQNDRNTEVEDYAGLGFRYPALGLAMTVFMFSMAGIPPTVGFAGKYLIFSAAVQAGEIWLTILAVLCSAISAYYYLRVIVVMYMKEPLAEKRVSFAPGAVLVILAATIATVQFGVFPTALIEIAKKAALNI